ncbi:hypothetical protein EDD37DRAFT_636048 [Exophiala viscosa]|uniref:Uncharacterized protein n=1 Tax=Exophiala viscosa TaxID=2486360 RepID=A0AAN6DZZ0_9EURO|nr:hypothetical protein EDD36DRAFT_433524 [Exophiala viscosa]KAI1621724.1 hypothetical protein EDD37DRAFT_636048 [Exophiala viscosa]
MDSDTVIDGHNKPRSLPNTPFTSTTVIVDDQAVVIPADESDAIINSYNKLHDLPNDPPTPPAVIVDDELPTEPLNSTTLVHDEHATATTGDGTPPKQTSSAQTWLTSRLVHLVIELASFFAHSALTARYLTQSRTRKTAEHESCLTTAMQIPCQTCLDNLRHCNANAEKAREGVVIGLDWVDIAAIIVLAVLWRAFLAASEKWLVAKIAANKNKLEE